MFIQRIIQFHDDGFTVSDEAQGVETAWSQFIVPGAFWDGQKMFIQDFTGQKVLVLQRLTDGMPYSQFGVQTNYNPDHYGQEEEVWAVLFPFQHRLKLKIEYGEYD